MLTWTNPPHNIDGSAATDLAHVLIRTNGAPLATVNVSGAGMPQSYVMPAGPGDRTFTVVVDTSQGKVSNASNAVSITPVSVPGRVSRLRAVVDQRRIVLQWDKPQDNPDLADAYFVVRTDMPAEAETVSDTRYEDTRYQQGKMVTYQVTPVRRVSGNTLMGVGPESVTLTIEDKTPPHVPAGLDVVQSDTGLYLTWDPNSETDLAGYRVFRSDRADVDFKPVSDRPITTNAFFDQLSRPGMSYAVSAVDEFGNESARSAPIRVQ